MAGLLLLLPLPPLLLSLRRRRTRRRLLAWPRPHRRLLPLLPLLLLLGLCCRSGHEAAPHTVPDSLRLAGHAHRAAQLGHGVAQRMHDGWHGVSGEAGVTAGLERAGGAPQRVPPRVCKLLPQGEERQGQWDQSCCVHTEAGWRRRAGKAAASVMHHVISPQAGHQVQAWAQHRQHRSSTQAHPM